MKFIPSRPRRSVYDEYYRSLYVSLCLGNYLSDPAFVTNEIVGGFFLTRSGESSPNSFVTRCGVFYYSALVTACCTGSWDVEPISKSGCGTVLDLHPIFLKISRIFSRNPTIVPPPHIPQKMQKRSYSKSNQRLDESELAGGVGQAVVEVVVVEDVVEVVEVVSITDDPNIQDSSHIYKYYFINE